MIDDIRIEAGPGETRAAFLDAGELVRMVVDRHGTKPRAGDILSGRVCGIAAGIDAAFVDIGDDRDGFLGLPEVAPPGRRNGRIGDYLREGDTVIAQVLRAAEPGKGAKLTLRPALAGRFVVSLPTETGVRVSRRIGDTAEGERVTALLPDGEGGWLVRRAAPSASEDMLAAEVERLQNAWLAIGRGADPPARLARGPNDVVSALRDEATEAVRSIVTDGPAAAGAARAAVPDLADRVHVVGPGQAFTTDDVESQVAALMSPVIPLAGGGVVTVTQTPALVAVDVDTGSARGSQADAVAFSVDMEAVRAVARRLRLADIGGYVVVDVVPLRQAGHRDAVLAELRNAVGDDQRPVRIGGWTSLGRLELTRRREGPSLTDQLMADCPACDGQGRVASPATTALAALRSVIAEDRAYPGRTWGVGAPPKVISYLRGPGASAVADAEARLGRRVILRSNPALIPDRVEVFESEDAKAEESDERG